MLKKAKSIIQVVRAYGVKSYFFNYVCGIGPLGKQGTLYLDGNIFKKAVMTNFGHGETRHDTEEDESAGRCSVSYDLTFQVSLQC